jgi:hypothetical protein
MYRQHPPYAVQVELTQGCNLACTFCGINDLGYQSMSRGKDCMSPDTALALAEQIDALDWNPRIEFAMHGEPTLNPYMHEIVGIFRRELPKAFLMMTSNGGGLLKDTTRAIDDLFTAGLNTLALDNYESVNIVPKILSKYAGAVRVVQYPDDPEGNPHHRQFGQLISIVQDISVADDGTHSHLNNHAGSAAPLNDRGVGKRCAKPFRELSVRWDGNVALCCNDWPGAYRCGSILREGLDAVWQGKAFVAARQMLLRGRREFAPCKGCDATSYRVGLLPDPKGVEGLPDVDGSTTKALNRALVLGPYTTRGKDPRRKP